MCIRDTIEVTYRFDIVSETPEGTSLKYSPLDYLVSLSGHSYTQEEVKRRAEAIAASETFSRARAPYEAALERYVSDKLKRALDRWERDRANSAVLNKRFDEPMPTREDFLWESWPSSERPDSPIQPKLTCISIDRTTKNLTYRALWAVGPVFLFPLAIALSLFLLWLVWSTSAGVYRWIAAGFRPSVPLGQRNPHAGALSDTTQMLVSSEAVQKPFKRKSVIFGLLAALMATFVAVTLSSVTRQSLSSDGIPESAYIPKATSSARGHDSKETLRRVEQDLRKHLPIQVIPGVTATNIQLHDRGMRWLYQVDSQLLGNEPGEWLQHYSLVLRQQACQNQAVLEILTNGFEVSYEIRSAKGQNIGTVTIAECA